MSVPRPARRPLAATTRHARWLVLIAMLAVVAAAAPAAAAPAPELRFAPDLAHTVAHPAMPAQVATPSPSATVTTPAPSAAPRSGAAPLRRVFRGSGPQAPVPFVRANGVTLTLGGQPWRFVGYDDYRLTSAAPGYQCGGPLTTADVAAALDDIHANSGATVVRTWFMQSYGGPGNWTQFDRVLAAAAARGMKVIPVLGDQWAACEPWPAGQTHYRTLAWYQAGYQQADPGYSLSYRDYVAAMARHYAGNPTIAFWQLMNEAEAMVQWNGACDDAAANTALRAFADDAAGVIKAQDPNHLVSLGTIGTGQCGASTREDYRNLHAGLIDICEYHDYLGPGAIPGDQWHGIALRISDCHMLNKPIFAGEVGLQASIAGNGATSGAVTDSTLGTRASDMLAKLQGQFGAGVSGFLVWQYAPGPRTDNYEVQPGDPLEATMAAFAATLGSAHCGLGTNIPC